MGTTSVIVVNTALELIASQTTITSLTDGSQAANAAQIIYQPVVQLLMRELDPDFARFTAALTAASVSAPVVPWAYEYLYPSDCVRLRQVRPSSGTYDINDPQPVRANVAFDTVSSVATKVILTNQASALAVYTSSNATEGLWDSTFAETVSRRLANPLAMALSGRPDFAKELLEQAAQMAQTCEAVDEGGFKRF